MYMDIFGYIYVYIYIHIHTYTYIYIYIYPSPGLNPAVDPKPLYSVGFRVNPNPGFYPTADAYSYLFRFADA